jgi:hypothetical protein
MSIVTLLVVLGLAVVVGSAVAAIRNIRRSHRRPGQTTGTSGRDPGH